MENESEPDLEGRAVGFVGGAGIGVVFAVEEAGNARALGARDPKVG